MVTVFWWSLSMREGECRPWYRLGAHFQSLPPAETIRTGLRCSKGLANYCARWWVAADFDSASSFIWMVGNFFRNQVEENLHRKPAPWFSKSISESRATQTKALGEGSGCSPPKGPPPHSKPWPQILRWLRVVWGHWSCSTSIKGKLRDNTVRLVHWEVRRGWKESRLPQQG